MAYCYECDKLADLSPRSRCVECEYKRAVANEQENEKLRERIIELQQTLGDVMVVYEVPADDFLKRVMEDV